MNKIFSQRVAFLLSLATLTAVSSGLSARAETTDSQIADALAQPVAESAIAPLTADNTLVMSDLAPMPNQLLELEPLNGESWDTFGVSELPARSSSEAIAKKQPVPGTAETSASALLDRSTTAPSSNIPAASDQKIAQELAPGRATRSGSSYLGIGGNVGIAGDTGVGGFGFSIFSKIGLTNAFSFRPAVVFSGDTDILLPITYDFTFQAEPFQRINFAPYVGAGAIITTSGDSNVGLLLTGGVDLPLTEQFTATAAFNFGFNTDTVGIGLLFGIGYNFGAGFRF